MGKVFIRELLSHPPVSLPPVAHWGSISKRHQTPTSLRTDWSSSRMSSFANFFKFKIKYVLYVALEILSEVHR